MSRPNFLCKLFTTNLIFKFTNLHENSEVGEMIASTDGLVIIWFDQWTSFFWPWAVKCRPKDRVQGSVRIVFLETTVTLCGCLNVETRIATSFKPEWLFDFVLRSHGDYLTSYRICRKWHLLCLLNTRQSVLRKSATTLLAPVHPRANFIHKGEIVLRYAMLLRDFEPDWKSSSHKEKKNPGELVPVLHFRVVPCKRGTGRD